MTSRLLRHETILAILTALALLILAMLSDKFFTVDNLLKPENKGQLTKILTAHVVPGKLSTGELRSRIDANGGSYAMATASGDTLTATKAGLAVAITDENGGRALVVNPDVNQSNGVIHVVNKVLLPN